MATLIDSIQPKGWGSSDPTASLQKVQHDYGVAFPGEYCDILKVTNGGKMTCNIHLYAVEKDISTGYAIFEFISYGDKVRWRSLEKSPNLIDEYVVGGPVRYFPIAATSADEYICLDYLTNDPMVCLISFGTRYLLADNFASFVEKVESAIQGWGGCGPVGM